VGTDVETTKPNEGKIRIMPLGLALCKELSPTERLIAAYLLWRQGNNGAAWPSEETIADEVGVNEKTVRRTVKALVEIGAIKIRRPRNQGRGKSIRYTVQTAFFEQRKGGQNVHLPEEKGGQNVR